MPNEQSLDDVINVPLEDIDLFVNQSREHFGEEELSRLADDLLLRGQFQAGLCWLDAGRKRLVLVAGNGVTGPSNGPASPGWP